MKVLLTGATGFLGSHLAHQLLKQGCQVIALKRCSSDLKRIQSILSDISTYDIDACNLTQPFKDHGKIDAIIHAATCYGRNSESPSEIFEANLMLPMRLLEAATFFNTDVFFNTDTFFNIDAISCKYLNNYSLSKKQFAEWGKGFAQSEKIKFINIRLEHMYGPGDDESKFVTHVIKSCIANVSELKLTPGEQKRDFIYIDDVVSAYMILLEKSKQLPKMFKEYGLGTGNAITIRQFVETVHQVTKSRTHLNFGLPYRENEIMQSEADVTALKDLGWICQIDLLEGINRCMEK